MTGDLTENEIAGAELMAGDVAREVAIEEAARREAEAKARMQAELAGMDTEGPEEEWYEEGGEEGGKNMLPISTTPKPNTKPASVQGWGPRSLRMARATLKTQSSGRRSKAEKKAKASNFPRANAAVLKAVRLSHRAERTASTCRARDARDIRPRGTKITTTRKFVILTDTGISSLTPIVVSLGERP